MNYKQFRLRLVVMSIIATFIAMYGIPQLIFFTADVFGITNDIVIFTLIILVVVSFLVLPAFIWWATVSMLHTVYMMVGYSRREDVFYSMLDYRSGRPGAYGQLRVKDVLYLACEVDEDGGPFQLNWVLYLWFAQRLNRMFLFIESEHNIESLLNDAIDDVCLIRSKLEQ